MCFTSESISRHFSSSHLSKEGSGVPMQRIALKNVPREDDQRLLTVGA